MRRSAEEKKHPFGSARNTACFRINTANWYQNSKKCDHRLSDFAGARQKKLAPATRWIVVRSVIIRTSSGRKPRGGRDRRALGH